MNTGRGSAEIRDFIFKDALYERFIRDKLDLKDLYIQRYGGMYKLARTGEKTLFFKRKSIRNVFNVYTETRNF